jgi:drug/metabolite transporter (DMT)-like permease
VNQAATPPLESGPASAGFGAAFAALLIGAVCIAMSPIFVRVSETGPTATAFWRVALAVPVLWLLYAAWGRRPAHAGNTAHPAVHISVKLTSVANSTLLANLAAIFVTLAMWLLFRQKPTRLFLVGLATALAGVTMLVSTSIAFSPTALAGDALGVVTAMFYAWYLLTVKRLRDDGAGTLHLMAVTTTITALILFPIALATGEQMLPGSTSGWLKLVGIAMISHAGGQGLIAFSLAKLPATFSSVSLLLQPVMAGVFAWMLLAEPLAPLQIAGGLVVLAGIYLARKGSAA